MASLEDAFWIQLAGFVMILIGNLLYSDALLMPSIRKIREDFLKLNLFPSKHFGKFIGFKSFYLGVIGI